MNNCICGHNPPADPNPDCERCRLIIERDEARTAMRQLVDIWVPLHLHPIVRKTYPWLEDEK